MKVSTNWLKDFVALTPPLERLAERLTMAGLEVKRIESRPDIQDTVFEVEITTNRPDWLSHLGIAREIHAIENTGIKLPSIQNPANRPMPSGWKLDLKEAEGCPYYTACLLEGIQDGETPEWMRSRLLACGIRPISLIVDVTNYVLLEVGQPLHAFDADLIKGQEVIIRRARPEEIFVAIDGRNYRLGVDDLVIADKERAVAIAGVMGGQATEVGARTRNILLESAFFHPRWVRKTSLKLGLSSESSYRFERRVDPEGVDLGRERALTLFRELTKVRSVSAVIKAGRKPTLEKPRIHLSLDQVKKILGAEIKSHEVHSVLTRLGLDPKKENPENWVVSIPSYRPDLERAVDLVEEVARIIGYDTLPETLPERAPIDILPNPLRELEERTRNFFQGAGLFETVTFSLVNPKFFEPISPDPKQWVFIHNPIHQELTLLRPNFLSSLLEVCARNERNGERNCSIYELANRYLRKSKGGTPSEERMLSVLIAGERSAGWNDSKRPFNFFDLKGFLESYLESLGIDDFSFIGEEKPYVVNSADIRVGKESIGWLGEVLKSATDQWDLDWCVYYAELNLEKLCSRLPKERKCREIPRYPAVERDLSLVVEEAVLVDDVIKEISRRGKGLIRKIELFDVFRGGRVPPGKKNLAYRLTYQSLERTLLSEEIQKLHQQIADELTHQFEARFQASR